MLTKDMSGGCANAWAWSRGRYTDPIYLAVNSLPFSLSTSVTIFFEKGEKEEWRKRKKGGRKEPRMKREKEEERKGCDNSEGQDLERKTWKRDFEKLCFPCPPLCSSTKFPGCQTLPQASCVHILTLRMRKLAPHPPSSAPSTPARIRNKGIFPVPTSSIVPGG